MIKARITEEVEGAFQARYEGLTRDHADMQTTLTALRRELQAARTELDTTARRGRTEADGARLQAERAAGDLRDEQARCRELHEARDALRRKLNAVEGEKSLLAAEVLELKAELQEVRGRAQSATVERETIAIDCERTIAKMKVRPVLSNCAAMFQWTFDHLLHEVQYVSSFPLLTSIIRTHIHGHISSSE